MIAALRILLAALAIPLACLLAPPALAAIPQFTDNNDGTITDNYTGLMWDKCSWGQSAADCSGGAASAHTWQQALAVATTANTGNHKNYADWRLPNIKELESIVNLGVSNPAINTTAFPNTPSNWFWSSTTYAPDPANAWGVNFGDGHSSADFKSNTGRVRLVRSGQSFGPFDWLPPVTSYTAATATASGSATASFTGGGASCGFTVSQFIPVSGVATAPPAGLTFPQGLFDFTAGGCTAGGTVSFTVTYPSALPAGAQYWKYGPTAADHSYHWYVLPATIAGNTATFSITDGGLGDDDLTANGTIVDQGGPGIPGGGAGGAGAMGVPTLSEWGMILLSLLLAVTAMLRRRGML